MTDAPAAVPDADPGGKKPFVLVHGAWHGGWCWRDTARLLREAGHEVYAPTLTGLADRSHLLSADISIATHVADIVGLIRWEALRQVVLVGHSYAGSVICGVGDEVPERLAALVYLDATIPGVSDPLPPFAPKPGVIGEPPPPASYFGVPPEQEARLEQLMTAQPVGCRATPYATTGANAAVPRHAFLAALDRPNPQRARDTLARLADNPAWELRSEPWGHDMMVDRPRELADYLLQFA